MESQITSAMPTFPIANRAGKPSSRPITCGQEHGDYGTTIPIPNSDRSVNSGSQGLISREDMQLAADPTDRLS
jgi:hypothetical protein